MLGAARCMDRTQSWLWLSRSRSGRSTGCYRLAFEPLSHAYAGASFHHKTHCPAPQSPRPGLENFRAATGSLATSSSTLHNNNKAPRSPSPSPLFGLHLRIASAFGPSYRYYSSRHPTSPTMAEVKWTGPLVRKTFLDFFAERGHSIGRPHAPPSLPLQKQHHQPTPPTPLTTTPRRVHRCPPRALAMAASILLSLDFADTT
jgi:hypothetical protein